MAITYSKVLNYVLCHAFLHSQPSLNTKSNLQFFLPCSFLMQDLVSQEESSCSKPIPIRAEDDSEELRSIAPLLDKCTNSFSMVQFVEMTMVLVVIFSILSMIFMGDGHEARDGNGIFRNGKFSRIHN